MEEKKATEDLTLFMCDPVKNTACRKNGCVHSPTASIWACYATTSPAFAVLDENGEPMRVNVKLGLKLPVFRDEQLLARLSGKNDDPCNKGFTVDIVPANA